MSEVDRREPPAAFRFRVELGGEVAGWFSEIGAIAIERAATALSQGGVNDHQEWLPGGLKRSSVTLRRGIASEALWQWFSKGTYDGQVERRDVSIILLDGAGAVARRWELPGALPRRWGGVQLRSDDSTMVIEELELGQGGPGAAAVQRVPDPRCPPAAGGRPPALDVQFLARKVFDLLKQELRVEQERRGRHDLSRGL
jgi:phage tail-like protein